MIQKANYLAALASAAGLAALASAAGLAAGAALASAAGLAASAAKRLMKVRINLQLMKRIT